MKLKQLLLPFSITAALMLVIVLNKNYAAAQGSSTPGPVGCGLIYSALPNQVPESAVAQSCGRCTVYKITEGWTPPDGIASKYYTENEEAVGFEVNCKTGGTASCTKMELSGGVTCPPEPSDLPAPNTGTGTSTSTGSH